MTESDAHLLRQSNEGMASNPQEAAFEGTPSSRDVDEVARAIFLVGEDWDTKASFDSLPDYGQDFWRDRARAAIAAMSPSSRGDVVEALVDKCSHAAYDEMRSQGFSGGWDHEALVRVIVEKVLSTLSRRGPDA